MIHLPLVLFITLLVLSAGIGFLIGVEYTERVFRRIIALLPDQLGSTDGGLR